MLLSILEHCIASKPHGLNWESNVQTYVTMCKAGNRGQGFAVYSTGRLRRAGIYVHLRLIHIVVWQKPAQRCRAVIRRLKIKKKKRNLVCFAYGSGPALGSHYCTLSVYGSPYSGHICFNGVITLQYVAFSFWLLSFRIMFTGSFRAIADLILWLSSISLCRYIIFCLSIHQLIHICIVLPFGY